MLQERLHPVAWLQSGSILYLKGGTVKPLLDMGSGGRAGGDERLSYCSDYFATGIVKGFYQGMQLEAYGLGEIIK